MEFINQLLERNAPLYFFGWICFGGAVFAGVMILATDTEVLGINAWIKPLKFFLSSVIFVWSMAWFMAYLPQTTVITWYTWVVIAVMAFELIYISYQAYLGQLSHFNVSSAFHGAMFSVMGTAISVMTLFTAYIGLLFFTNSFPNLSPAYLWGIRLGIILFVIFAFEGALMGARMAHTVGAPDGGPGLRFVNWSVTHGDLRIAHFIGMHALQVLPLAGYFLFSQPRWILIFGALYFALALGILVQALMGLPMIRQVVLKG